MVSQSRKTELTADLILLRLQQHKSDLVKMGVTRIGLFGSYRRGDATLRSDIDFLIKLDTPTFDRYMDIRFCLEDLFSVKVDLVLEETIKPRLRPQILSEVEYLVIGLRH